MKYLMKWKRNALKYKKMKMELMKHFLLRKKGGKHYTEKKTTPFM